MRKIAVIPGDGIGPEVIGSALEVLRAVDAPLEITEAGMGLECHKRTGSYLPQETLDILEGSDAALFGAITSPVTYDPSYRYPLLHLRKEFDLYANIRPVRRWHPSIGLVDLDVIIVRENTEGMYTGVEREDAEGVVTERRITRRACQRIVDKGIEVCRAEGRKSITCVHKSNVLRRSDGLFREIFSDVASSIRNQYTLAYHPTNAKLDGTYRKLKIELVDPQTGKPMQVVDEKGRQLKYNIIAREGYTAKHTVE
jgi:isocitrate/isopropylmalate dehydrogenase